MNKHPTSIITFGVLTVVTLAMVVSYTSANTRGSVASDCVGKPYGTIGCPLKASSGTGTSLTCGNGLVDAKEECDMGSNRNGVSNCSKTCKLLYCGDGLLSPGLNEECEPESEEVYGLDPYTGELIVEVRYLAASCGTVCTVPTCEKDGTCAGGCKRMFLPACIETSSSSSQQSAQAAGAQTPAVQGTSVCGNGVTDSGEQCDDGNQTNNDACINTCRIAICGDAITQPWEQCDDGNRVDGDACSNTCKSPACGDGIAQSGEECDDGNQQNNDACTNACKTPRCGDMSVQNGEECDDGNLVNTDNCTNQCRQPVCGDAILQAGEQCDDGNKSDADTCTMQCLFARCGDSVLQLTEECDDGNRVNNDSCSNVCKLASCGNGVRELNEECDDGNLQNNDACSIECKRPVCGDGYVQPGEFCDDGNQSNEDNCTTTCRVPTCGDGLLHPREECDDGRRNSDTRANACRSDCREPRCGDAIVDEGEQCDGGPTCDESCKELKSAAGMMDSDGGASSFAIYAIMLAGFGTAAVLAYVFRKNLHTFVAKTAGEDVARSIDDIPLDQIEMPWHKWQ